MRSSIMALRPVSFLTELKNEKDYGEWVTFENCVKAELGIEVRYAYRLMFAYRDAGVVQKTWAFTTGL